MNAGALNLYANAGPFTQAARDGAVAFAAALDEVAQMKEAMAGRAVIEQAKGIIMARERCTADRRRNQPDVSRCATAPLTDERERIGHA